MYHPEYFRSRCSAFLLGLLALALSIVPGFCILDPSLQMQLGNPSGATSDTNNHDHFLVVRSVEALDYSDNLREPVWASWDLTSDDLGNSGRSPNFFPDTNLPPNFYIVQSGDYSGSGFDRGHLCPSADRTLSVATNDLVFYMSNMMPQASDNNSGVWGNFEAYCRSLCTNNELLIICGPGGFDGTRIEASGSNALPAFTWKVAVVVPHGSGLATNRITTATRVISIKVPNTNGVSTAFTNFVTTAGQLEHDTGLTFFTALPGPLASALRSKLDGTNFPAPSITTFTPGSGGADAAIVINGTNLTSASVVSFNGTPAVFSVDSNIKITATVPLGATSGPISVTTPSGTATSATGFTVAAPGSLDLAITSTHTGNFTQGDPADTYTLQITNLSAVSSSGTVTVSNALPSGLTATVISGTGWTVDLPTLTCTRSDALPGISAYPPITITFSVASNAPASVTNVAILSGGNDTNLANNVAIDPTTINPPAAPDTIVLAGWDTSTVTNYGVSPLAPTTNAGNLVITGLTRGSGVATNSNGAARGWGGVAWTNVTAAAAIGSNQFVTCRLAASAGYQVSYAAISRFDYRHSGTGPTNGLLQYQIGTNGFTDITSISYPSTNSAGASLSPISLSGISALQNVGPGTNVTFRVVNYGGSSSSGTWYIFDVTNSSAPDFAITGTVFPAFTPIESWRFQYFGTITNAGAAADTAIASADGMPNLLKYALGLNPLIATKNPVMGDITTGFLRLTLPRNPNATDITYYVEVTSSVQGPWTTNGTVMDQNTSTLLQVHDATPVSSALSRFMRLEVTRP